MWWNRRLPLGGSWCSTTMNDLPSVTYTDTLWLSVKLRHSDSLLLGSVYRSPAFSGEKDLILITGLENIIRSNQFSHLLSLSEFDASSIDWQPSCSAVLVLVNPFCHFPKKLVPPNMLKNPPGFVMVMLPPFFTLCLQTTNTQLSMSV